MPPGSKKRKAAKKKKEKDASLSHNQNHNQEPEPQSAVCHTHENDDLKHSHGKESEGEEVSSPASQDHTSHQHQLTDGGKEDLEKVEDTSHVQLSSEGSKSVEEFKDNGGALEEVKVEDSAARIEMEPEPAMQEKGNNIIEEHLEGEKESGDGVVSQHADEERVLEIERVVKHFERLDASVEHVEPQKEPDDGVLESHNDEYHVIDKTNIVVDNSPFGSSTEAVNSFSGSLIQVPNPVPVGEVYTSVVESGSDTFTDNVGSACEKLKTNGSSPGDSLLTSDVGLPGLEGNERTVVAVLDQNGRSLSTVVNSGLENKRAKAVVVAGDAPSVSDAKNTLSKDTDEKLLLPYNVPREENGKNTSNGSDHIKDSEVHESSDTQPLVASAVRRDQRTSWMSCCGLFEVLAGSN